MRLSGLLALSAAALLAASCSTHHSSLAYFENAEVAAPATVGDYNVKIEPGDELLITVNSRFPEASNEFNVAQVNPATNSGALVTTSPRQQTYVVDSKGDILFPKFGAIHVQGMTTEQLRDLLLEKITPLVIDPVVKVQLVNFYVDVAGEVLAPGRVQVNSERFSVLDALTSAGDLTPFGQRQNVMLIREENGKRVAHRLDLNKAETLNSPYFFVKQNDYIYVEPTKVRRDNAEYNTNNSYKLSVVSTIVSGCSVIASLIIALTVK